MNRPAPVVSDDGPDLSVPFAAARAAALDELARPAPRRSRVRLSLFDRAAPAPLDRAGPDPSSRSDEEMPADPVHRTPAPRPGPRAAPPRFPLPAALGGRPAVALVAVLAAVALVAAVVVLRRPPPAEDTLPRATAEAVAVDGDPTSTTVGTVTVPSGSDAGTVTTTVPSGGPVTVHVAGAVARPGVVTLPAGSRVVDAVAAAGGMVPGADPDRVNLAAPLGDGQRVVVPVVGQAPPAEILPTGGAGPSGGAAGPSTGAAAAGPVDLNTADEAALDALPGIGPATAQAIVAHRQESGPFGSVDELLDVRGIGDAKLEALRDLVTVGP